MQATAIDIMDGRGVARRFSSSPEESAILGVPPLPISVGEHTVRWEQIGVIDEVRLEQPSRIAAFNDGFFYNLSPRR